MSCTNCEKTEDCGCTQEALSINQICNPVQCEEAECSESFDANCSIWMNNDIVCQGVTLATMGDSISQVMANVSAYFCNAVSQPVPGNVMLSLVSSIGVKSDQGTVVVANEILTKGLFSPGSEYEMDLFLEYKENDPVDLEISLGTNGTWTYPVADSEDVSLFINITITHETPTAQLWVIKILRYGTSYVNEVIVHGTTTDATIVEPFSIKLINGSGAVNNALTLYKAVVKSNMI